jgi:hypothetical protein
VNDTFHSVRDLLFGVGRSTVAEIDYEMNTNLGGGLTIAGWRELLAQLAFLRRVGML